MSCCTPPSAAADHALRDTPAGGGLRRHVCTKVLKSPPQRAARPEPEDQSATNKTARRSLAHVECFHCITAGGRRSCPGTPCQSKRLRMPSRTNSIGGIAIVTISARSESQDPNRGRRTLISGRSRFPISKPRENVDVVFTKTVRLACPRCPSRRPASRPTHRPRPATSRAPGIFPASAASPAASSPAIK